MHRGSVRHPHLGDALGLHRRLGELGGAQVLQRLQFAGCMLLSCCRKRMWGLRCLLSQHFL